MNFEPTEEEREFLENFRKFCSREIAPHAKEIEKKGEVPLSHFRKLSEVGYNGLLHEEKFGGSNSSYLLATLAQEILAEHCGATFFSVGASLGIFASPIREYGTEEQKRKFLPPVIRGEKIGALGVTEPDAGSDVTRLKAIAKKKGDQIILNGQKTFITNAPVCDFAVILVNFESEEKNIGQTCFIVETTRKGIARGKPMDKMGLRGSPTGELFFEDVKLTEDDILGRPGKGFKIIMEAFNRERLGLGAYSVGVMAACLTESRKYSKERKAFGRPIGKHQSVAFMLADMLTKYEASRCLLHETAWMMDKFSKEKKNKPEHNGYPVDLTAKTATVKLLASTYAREVTNLAVQIHGGAGYMNEYKVARLYRDIKIAEIGGGTSEILKQIIAHSETKRVK